jgi:hypothetical protein
MGVGDWCHAPAALPPVKRPGTRFIAVWLGPTGIRSPDLPARRKSLYRLSYPGPPLSLNRGQCNMYMASYTGWQYIATNYWIIFSWQYKVDRRLVGFDPRPVDYGFMVHIGTLGFNRTLVCPLSLSLHVRGWVNNYRQCSCICVSVDSNVVFAFIARRCFLLITAAQVSSC